MPDTGEMQFGTEPTGLYIRYEDARVYYAALHTILEGRSDPISQQTFMQLLDLLREADDDEVGEVQFLKSFEMCIADLAAPKYRQKPKPKPAE